MSAFLEEKVLSVHHWTDRLFSFTTTRDTSLRFSNGHFTMIGLRGENGKPLLRAYSIVSANYEEHLEFLSIKVADGPLTSRLQHIQVGDTVIVGRKPTGTLVVDYLLPGKRLYLLSTGTGLAPFMSIVRDPETYERYEQVILVHGVRQVDELAYRECLTEHLPNHEFLGELVKDKLRYYPARAMATAGGDMHFAKAWEPHVVVDRELITGTWLLLYGTGLTAQLRCTSWSRRRMRRG